MFGFKKRNKYDDLFNNIIQCGKEIAELALMSYTKEETAETPENLRWKHSQRWCEFCATIPLFSFIVSFEDQKRGFQPPSTAQTLYFQTIEDMLHDYFARDRYSYSVNLKQCIPLESERRIVCGVLGITDDVNTSMDVVLGVLFPTRYRRYYRDWHDAFMAVKRLGAGRSQAEAPAIRVLADLRGVQVADNLVGLLPRVFLGNSMFVEGKLTLFSLYYHEVSNQR